MTIRFIAGGEQFKSVPSTNPINFPCVLKLIAGFFFGSFLVIYALAKLPLF